MSRPCCLRVVTDREHTSAAQGSLGGLDAMADLAVDHRLPQRSYSCGEGFAYLCHESNVHYEH
jgi:hypothetical protein